MSSEAMCTRVGTWFPNANWVQSPKMQGIGTGFVYFFCTIQGPQSGIRIYSLHTAAYQKRHILKTHQRRTKGHVFEFPKIRVPNTEPTTRTSDLLAEILGCRT